MLRGGGKAADSDSDHHQHPSEETDSLLMSEVTMEELCDVNPKKNRHRKSEKRPLLNDEDDLGCCSCMEGDFYLQVNTYVARHQPKQNLLRNLSK